jgi:hypothetical protein
MMSMESTAQELSDGEPGVERQAELRAAYAGNIATGKPPYARVNIRNRHELQWILRERGWSSTVVQHRGSTGVIEPPAAYAAAERPRPLEWDERMVGAVAQTIAATTVEVVWAEVKRQGAKLWRRKATPLLRSRRYGLEPGTGGQEQDYADLREANLFGINLQDADLQRVDLGGANIRYANLRRANLLGANLRGAYLWDTDLTEAVLRETNLAGADLGEAILHQADLRLARLVLQRHLRGRAGRNSCRGCQSATEGGHGDSRRIRHRNQPDFMKFRCSSRGDARFRRAYSQPTLSTGNAWEAVAGCNALVLALHDSGCWERESLTGPPF